jgi:hypothetical protein
MPGEVITEQMVAVLESKRRDLVWSIIITQRQIDDIIAVYRDIWGGSDASLVRRAGRVWRNFVAD